MKQLSKSKNIYNNSLSNLLSNLLILISKFKNKEKLIQDKLIQEKLIQDKKIKIECYLKSSNCKYDPIYDYCFICNSNISDFKNKCF